MDARLSFSKMHKVPTDKCGMKFNMKALNELQSLNLLMFLKVQNDLAVILILMLIVYVFCSSLGVKPTFIIHTSCLTVTKIVLH